MDFGASHPAQKALASIFRMSEELAERRDQPHDVGMLGAKRHEVDQQHGSLSGLKAGLQN